MKIKKEMMPFHSLFVKQKYNVEDKNVVVVEKSNTILKIVVVTIKILGYTILLSLAFIGLVSIIIPETRSNLLMQANHVFDEFFGMVGG